MVDDSDGRHDFDFLHGRWRVHNERLARRLAGSHEWHRFDARCECWPVLDGIGNQDRYQARFPDGQPLEGLTLRLFDPATRSWSIYWADSRRGRLDPPVVGRFADGRGRFVGDDLFEGRPIRVAFVWTVVSAHEARWEQAFSDDGGERWETNWRMSFVREEG
jgi:hypothetical protein